MSEAQPHANGSTIDTGFLLVTVLIPVRNEQGFIGRCLRAIAAQDYPHERIEVFVIDGESDDETEHEVQHTAEEVELTVYFLSNPNRTTASGMNLGLSHAHGDVIIKVDGHTRVEPSFVSASVRALQESGADAVGGPITTRGHGYMGRAIALALASPFGVGDTAFRHSDKEQWTDSVPYGAYRREVFDRVGLFAEDIDRGEDDEFNYRLRDAGGRILLTPSIRSTYYSRESLKDLARQYWNYGLAKSAVLQRHPERRRLRHLIPSAFVVTLVGGTLLGPISRPLGRMAALTAAAYTVANGIATLRIARQGNWREARYLPAAFATIHLSAGTGMSVGWWRNRKSPKTDA